MRRQRSWVTWLALGGLLAGALLFGGRWLVMQYYDYPMRYRAIVVERAQEFDLDPFLVAAVIRTESGFKANAVSSQGARGLMQIMPETGAEIALRMDLPFATELLFDPDYNVRLGSWYLAHLSLEFEGNLVVALAAYNGGKTNVRGWLAENRWSGDLHTLNQIPFPETREYVARVLRNLQWYRRLYGGSSEGRSESEWQAKTGG